MQKWPEKHFLFVYVIFFLYFCVAKRKIYTIMSAVQAAASKQFLEAMGPMIYDEQKLKQVFNYIASIQPQGTISQEKFDSLRTIDELDIHLEARIRNHYQNVKA